ncbi:MAG: hypothetical protein WCS34_00765 [Bacteroidales bacterium]
MEEKKVKDLVKMESSELIEVKGGFNFKFWSKVIKALVAIIVFVHDYGEDFKEGFKEGYNDNFD